MQDWGKAQKVGKPKMVTSNQLGEKEQLVADNQPSDTVETRAKTANVSRSTQKKADAVSKASPELAAQVARG